MSIGIFNENLPGPGENVSRLTHAGQRNITSSPGESSHPAEDLLAWGETWLELRLKEAWAGQAGLPRGRRGRLPTENEPCPPHRAGLGASILRCATPNCWGACNCGLVWAAESVERLPSQPQEWTTSPDKSPTLNHRAIWGLGTQAVASPTGDIHERRSSGPTQRKRRGQTSPPPTHQPCPQHPDTPRHTPTKLGRKLTEVMMLRCPPHPGKWRWSTESRSPFPAMPQGCLPPPESPGSRSNAQREGYPVHTPRLGNRRREPAWLPPVPVRKFSPAF